MACRARHRAGAGTAPGPAPGPPAPRRGPAWHRARHRAGGRSLYLGSASHRGPASVPGFGFAPGLGAVSGLGGALGLGAASGSGFCTRFRFCTGARRCVGAWWRTGVSARCRGPVAASGLGIAPGRAYGGSAFAGSRHRVGAGRRPGLGVGVRLPRRRSPRPTGAARSGPPRSRVGPVKVLGRVRQGLVPIGTAEGPGQVRQGLARLGPPRALGGPAQVSPWSGPPKSLVAIAKVPGRDRQSLAPPEPYRAAVVSVVRARHGPVLPGPPVRGGMPGTSEGPRPRGAPGVGPRPAAYAERRTFFLDPEHLFRE